MKNAGFIFSILALIFLFSNNMFCQTKIDSSNYVFSPSPVIGWDSLKTLIERPENYPEILRRTGMIGQISLKIEVDSAGKLLDIEPVQIIGLDSLFIPPVKNILESISWRPGSLNGKHINNVVYLSFAFHLYYPWNHKFFIIGAPGIGGKAVE